MAPTLSPEVRNVIRATADQAASRTVKATFLTMGIDVSTPEGIRQAQQDNHFVRRLRTASEAKYIVLWGAGIALFNALVVLGAQFVIEKVTAP